MEELLQLFVATLSCPFRYTMRCQFRIKYQIRNERLRIWSLFLTIAKHTHDEDIRVRGLSLDKATKVYEAVVNSPSSE